MPMPGRRGVGAGEVADFRKRRMPATVGRPETSRVFTGSAGCQSPAAKRPLGRGSLHAACAIDRLRRREAASARPKGSAFRCSSREMVAFARPSARAMAPIDRAAARKTRQGQQCC